MSSCNGAWNGPIPGTSDGVGIGAKGVHREVRPPDVDERLGVDATFGSMFSASFTRLRLARVLPVAGVGAVRF